MELNLLPAPMLLSMVFIISAKGSELNLLALAPAPDQTNGPDVMELLTMCFSLSRELSIPVGNHQNHETRTRNE